MCGIFGIFNNLQHHNISNEYIETLFYCSQGRGPENSTLTSYTNLPYHYTLGFHRLAINGYQDSNAMQPFHSDDIQLICNGEIYNHKELFDMINIEPKSQSDCEIILHLYKKYGISQTLQMIDGVFSFILMDLKNNLFFVARDTFGIRPLFVNTITDEIGNQTFVFASELKSANIVLDIDNKSYSEVKQFDPGHVSFFEINKYDTEKIAYKETLMFSSPNSFSVIKYSNLNSKRYINGACAAVFSKLEDAVIKRVENTERDVACLLSGGLDSSIICALVKRHCKGTLHTWSIGLEGSEDLKYAALVADHIGSVHHSIVVNEQEFLDAIPDVIWAIESYDTTSVRASVGNWLISKYIRENSDAKVIFNGDGADELMGGYLYFHMAPDSVDFDKECRRLLSDIHYFDVLRSDRSISSHGLEARTPFLDRSFVQCYLSLDPNIRNHALQKQPEKYIIRRAVELYGDNLLPKEVLWRTKEAFSDGVSKQTKSWFEIIQEHVKHTVFKSFVNYNDEEILKNFNPYIINKPKTLEQLYYRDVFNERFKCMGAEKVIPYFWMPNFVNATDASARTLQVYKEKNNIEVDNIVPMENVILR
jgi:asparagine synthase (glutamine-hydrolysing)